MQRWIWIFLVTIVGSLSADTLFAQESIFLKGKEKQPPLKAAIKRESAQGVTTSTLIPAEDIVDIEYELTPILVRTGLYRKAREKEKESQEKETGKKVNIAEAIQLYEESLAKMAAGQGNVRRNIEFRIGLLRSRLALEFGNSFEPAYTKLEEFKNTHQDSWQITHCMRLLATMQLAQKNYAKAEKTYLELAGFPVPEDIKNEAQLLAAQVSVQAGKFGEAQKKLQALTKLPGRFGMQARVAEAECLAVAKKTDEANKILRQILKDSSDKSLKAMAYNTLGKNLFDQGQLKEARWEFLWVDVVYNQDKAEHAKALYFLAHIFEKLGEADRAQDCRELLLTDRQFAGLEFQRRAQAESKTP